MAHLWQPNTSYDKGVVVKYEEVVYVCKEGHVSINTFEKKRWIKHIVNELVQNRRGGAKRFTAISSMDHKYFNKYGRYFLKSVVHNLNKGIRFELYNEAFRPKVKSRIRLRGWDLGEEYNKFQERWWNVNKKVATFAKKGFTIIDAMENIDCDRLIWLDADLIINAPIHPQLLDLLSDDRYLSTHLGVVHNVEGKSWFSCETGFFILNKNHKQFNDFKETYKNIYYNDDHKDIRRFYDGEVYGKTVEIMKAAGAEMLDLNPEHVHKTCMPRSVLDPYMKHYKAGLKDEVDYGAIARKLVPDGPI